MEDAGFIFGSYVVTFASIAVYVRWMMRRAKKLAQNATPEELPWT